MALGKEVAMGVRSVLRYAASSLGLALALTSTHPLRAGDSALALREVAGSGDFRVRVTAALLLGRAKPAGALDALEHALADAHPAVRAASAEALGALGDPSALPALEQRSAVEASPSVKAQIRVTVDALRASVGLPPAIDGREDARDAAQTGDVRYVIALGAMRNGTGVRGDELIQVLSDAARTRTNAWRGATVMESDASARKHGAVRHVPVITLDGNVAQMVESRIAGNVQVHARVEFTVRRDQTLKGTVSGAATTFGYGATISEQARRQLQNDAIDGAVQSALRGAEQGIIVAAR
jgi:hypothetical protein